MKTETSSLISDGIDLLQPDSDVESDQGNYSLNPSDGKPYPLESLSVSRKSKKAMCLDWLNSGYFILRIVTCFFFLQAYTLIVTELLNISIWLLYTIALPTSRSELSTTWLLLVSISSIMGLILFSCVGFTLASTLSYALLDLWSTKQNPVIVDHFNFLFRNSQLKLDHTDIVHCVKKQRTETERIIVYGIKLAAVTTAFIISLTQISGFSGPVITTFFTVGVVQGGIYAIFWILLRGAVVLKTIYLIGFRQGASYLGIHREMPLRNRLLWALCLSFYVLCIVLPVTTYSLLVPEERSRSAVLLFFTIFVIYPAIILGYFFEYYHHQKRKSVGKFITQQIILWVIVLLFVFLFVGVLRTTEYTPCIDPTEISTNFPGDFLFAREEVSATATDSYPICDFTWNGMNIVDYGLFANLAYLTKEGAGCSEKVADSLHYWFPDDPWKVVGAQKKGDVLGFLHLYNPAKMQSVITVRGTVPTRATDILQDFDLFKEISVLQAMSYVFPISKYWSDSMTQSFVYWASWIEKALSNREYAYYVPLLEYVESVQNSTQYPGPITFVGHSLGGAIAKIVGVKLNTTAIAFEAPGLVWSSKKFGLDVDLLHRLVVNVALSNDIVTEVDKHGGLLQHVPCPSGNPLTCHTLKTGLCIFHRSCDPAKGTNSGNLTMCK